MGKMFYPSIAANGILWLVGAAMQIGGWINQAIAIILLVIAFLWTIGLIWHWNKNSRVQENQNGQRSSQPDIKIHAKVQEIQPYGYYEQVFGGGSRDDYKVTIDVAFDILKPINLDILRLNIPAGKYEAKIENRLIQNSQIIPFAFDVPIKSAISTKEAKITAFANNEYFESVPFSIAFEASK